MLDAGKLPIYPEKIEVEAFLKLVRAHYQSIPGSNRVIWPPTTENFSLLVDVQVLQSVFIHVLDNALKSTTREYPDYNQSIWQIDYVYNFGCRSGDP